MIAVRYDRREIKIVQSFAPAYARYYEFVGVVLSENRFAVTVAVFGEVEDCRQGFALHRRDELPHYPVRPIPQ